MEDVDITVSEDGYYTFHVKLKENVNEQKYIEGGYDVYDDSLRQSFTEQGIKPSINEEKAGLSDFLMTFLPFVIIFGLFWFFLFFGFSFVLSR